MFLFYQVKRKKSLQHFSLEWCQLFSPRIHPTLRQDNLKVFAELLKKTKTQPRTLFSSGLSQYLFILEWHEWNAHNNKFITRIKKQRTWTSFTPLRMAIDDEFGEMVFWIIQNALILHSCGSSEQMKYHLRCTPFFVSSSFKSKWSDRKVIKFMVVASSAKFSFFMSMKWQYVCLINCVTFQPKLSDSFFKCNRWSFLWNWR